MQEQKSAASRSDLLADVAEMYFIDGLNQDLIAKRIGVTRSMVSRMLSEARRQGIVRINIYRPQAVDKELQSRLVAHFGLRSACVLASQKDDLHLLERLGAAGAEVLLPELGPGKVLGMPWGTTVSAVVDAIEVEEPVPMKIVQLVGALGSRNLEYDGHAVVQRLAQKLSGQAFYMNMPFLVENAETAQLLLSNTSVRETIDLTHQLDIALLGVGSTIPEFSSYYKAGYLEMDQLLALREAGAVGGICGFHFDIHGCPTGLDFERRAISITREDLLSAPTRIMVAGGIHKAEAILGALRGGYANFLVTDGAAATEALRLAASEPA